MGFILLISQWRGSRNYDWVTTQAKAEFHTQGGGGEAGIPPPLPSRNFLSPEILYGYYY